MEHLDDLVDDDEFWRFQARSLAVLATPDNARTFRVPNALVPIVEVSDRFHLKPLLRAIAFPNTCFVLALAENAVRVIQVSADLPPAVVRVDGMPKDAASAVGRASVNTARRAAVFKDRKVRRFCCANSPARSIMRCAGC